MRKTVSAHKSIFDLKYDGKEKFPGKSLKIPQ